MKKRKDSSIGSSPSTSIAKAIVDAWNVRHDIGDRITYITDNGEAVSTTITGRCEIVASCRVARVAAKDGWCCIDRLISF